MRFFSVRASAEHKPRRAQDLAGVTDPARELHAIKKLQHLDRQVAADTRAVAERAGGHQAVAARPCQSFRDVAELTQRAALEEPVLAQPDHQSVTGGAR